MPDLKLPATTPRGRAALIAGLALAAAGAATAILLTTSGTPPPNRPTAAQAAHARGLAAGRALNVGRGSGQAAPVPQVRLGLINSPADATALAGVHLGYFSVQLSPHGDKLTAIPYTSAAQETAALAAGRLDAAYLPPVSAVKAWQQTRGAVRIISGATARGSTTTAVLAIRVSFLTSHRDQAEDLLKGQVQATSLLITNPVAGHTAATAELTALRNSKAPAIRIRAALNQTRATCDPGAQSVLAQAKAAAASGQLQPVTTLAGIYDLAPLNKLLRTAGMATVSAA